MSDTGTEEQEEQEQEEQQQEDPGKDLAAEVAKWKSLARQNEKQAKANAAAARKLADMEENDKTETQKLLERAEAAEKAAAAAEKEAMRARVALRKNLPPKLASRLQGDTEAEMVADADELLAELGAAGKQPPPRFDGGSRKTSETGQNDMNARIREAAGRQ